MPNCEKCGQPMPEGEEMFRYHGHSGPCPVIEKPKWPKFTAAYLHGDKVTMWDLGRALGLSEEACKEFSYACYEVKVKIEVQENGTSKIIGVE
jgi:hypothetical protein